MGPLEEPARRTESSARIPTVIPGISDLHGRPLELDLTPGVVAALRTGSGAVERELDVVGRVERVLGRAGSETSAVTLAADLFVELFHDRTPGRVGILDAAAAVPALLGIIAEGRDSEAISLALTQAFVQRLDPPPGAAVTSDYVLDAATVELLTLFEIRRSSDSAHVREFLDILTGAVLCMVNEERARSAMESPRESLCDRLYLAARHVPRVADQIVRVSREWEQLRISSFRGRAEDLEDLALELLDRECDAIFLPKPTTELQSIAAAHRIAAVEAAVRTITTRRAWLTPLDAIEGVTADAQSVYVVNGLFDGSLWGSADVESTGVLDHQSAVLGRLGMAGFSAWRFAVPARSLTTVLTDLEAVGEPHTPERLVAELNEYLGGTGRSPASFFRAIGTAGRPETEMLRELRGWCERLWFLKRAMDATAEIVMLGDSVLRESGPHVRDGVRQVTVVVDPLAAYDSIHVGSGASIVWITEPYRGESPAGTFSLEIAVSEAAGSYADGTTWGANDTLGVEGATLYTALVGAGIREPEELTFSIPGLDSTWRSLPALTVFVRPRDEEWGDGDDDREPEPSPVVPELTLVG